MAVLSPPRRQPCRRCDHLHRRGAPLLALAAAALAALAVAALAAACHRPRVASTAAEPGPAATGRKPASASAPAPRPASAQRRADTKGEWTLADETKAEEEHAAATQAWLSTQGINERSWRRFLGVLEGSTRTYRCRGCRVESREELTCRPIALGSGSALECHQELWIDDQAVYSVLVDLTLLVGARPQQPVLLLEVPTSIGDYEPSKQRDPVLDLAVDVHADKVTVRELPRCETNYGGGGVRSVQRVPGAPCDALTRDLEQQVRERGEYAADAARTLTLVRRACGLLGDYTCSPVACKRTRRGVSAEPRERACNGWSIRGDRLTRP